MVLFHACYDLAYIYAAPVSRLGIDMSWFLNPVAQDLWRQSICCTFIFLAGWMTSFSRNNFKRAAVYAIAALVIYIATSVAGVDAAVNFGILYCMAASTFLFALIDRVALDIPSALVAACSFVLFILLHDIPKKRYALPYLSWLGFPDPGFSSGDYYPLIPWFFLYMMAGCLAKWFKARRSYPSWMEKDFLPPLTWIGRHSLAIYLLHQPLLIGVFTLVFR